MRTLFLLPAVIALLLAAAPASADDARNFIDDQLSQWNQLAAEDGYTVLQAIVDRIGPDSLTYTYDLDPGKYHVWISGGMNIEDIDATVTDASGKVLDSDTKPDKIPILVFILDQPQEVKVVLTQCSSTDNLVNDFFCLVLASEGDEARVFINDQLSQWRGLAAQDKYDVLQTIIDKIGPEPVAYTFDLGPGKYHLWISGGMNLEDIDASVTDASGEVLDSDTRPDKIPILVFTLEQRQEVHLTLTQFTSSDNYLDDYFCILVVAEPGSELFSTAGGPAKTLKPKQTKTGGPTYQSVMQGVLEDWRTFAQENDMTIMASDLVLAEQSPISISFDLDPGVYAIWGQCDERCNDLDVVVYDPAGNVLAQDREGYDNPYTVFLVSQTETVRIDFEVQGLRSGWADTYIVYMLELQGRIDDQSRQQYIEKDLEMLRSYAQVDKADIIDSGMATLTNPGDDMVRTYDLAAGSYVINATGGLLISDLNIAIFDASGKLLTEDNMPDSYPACLFSLPDPQSVTVQFTAVSFRGDNPSDYFCWCLSTAEITTDNSEG
jgi:hypothetical protein